MHERRALDPLERLAHGRLDAAPIELAHRVDADAALAHERALALVEGAHADEDDPLRVERRQRPRVARESLGIAAERRRQRHPVHVSTRARLGRVQVAVRVQPEHPARTVDRGEAAERPERDRVVAAEDDRRPPLPDRPGDRARRSRSQVSLIWSRKRACGLPLAVASATTVSTFPQSSQSMPRSWRRSSRPA